LGCRIGPIDVVPLDFPDPGPTGASTSELFATANAGSVEVATRSSNSHSNLHDDATTDSSPRGVRGSEGRDPAVLDTTESRWFADGPLPQGAEACFTRDGTLGVREERCDIYCLNGRGDIGVKLRARQTLELKIRRSVGERPTVGTDLTGQVEAWTFAFAAFGPTAVPVVATSPTRLCCIFGCPDNEKRNANGRGGR